MKAGVILPTISILLLISSLYSAGAEQSSHNFIVRKRLKKQPSLRTRVGQFLRMKHRHQHLNQDHSKFSRMKGADHQKKAMHHGLPKKSHSYWRGKEAHGVSKTYHERSGQKHRHQVGLDKRRQHHEHREHMEHREKMEHMKHMKQKRHHDLR